MILKPLFLSLLAAGMSTSVYAAEPKPQPPKPGEERADDVICTVESVLGSHLKRRVCTTRQAREERAKADQKALQGLQQSKAARGKATESGGGGFK